MTKGKIITSQPSAASDCGCARVQKRLTGAVNAIFEELALSRNHPAIEWSAFRRRVHQMVNRELDMYEG
jgi:hypothetical protein